LRARAPDVSDYSTLIGAGIAYLGVVTSQLWGSRQGSKRAQTDRDDRRADQRRADEALALHEALALLGELDDRKTGHILAGLGSNPVPLDTPIDVATGGAVGRSIGTRLKLLTPRIYDDDVLAVLSDYASDQMRAFSAPTVAALLESSVATRGEEDSPPSLDDVLGLIKKRLRVLTEPGT
jgi:hypothetical protein